MFGHADASEPLRSSTAGGRRPAVPGRRRLVPAAASALAAITWFVPSAAAAVPESAAPEQLFVVTDPALTEISGMALGSADGVVFVHQDAQSPATVTALDALGVPRLTIDVPGTENLDWEDLARATDESGRPALFVADVGDAFATRRGTGSPPRTSFSLVRFTEPEVSLDDGAGGGPRQVVAQDVVSYPLRYGDDGARNAEAMAVHPTSNRVVVVDKVEAGGRQAYIWVAPSTLDPAAPNTLRRVAKTPVTGVSGAAFSPAGDVFAVRDAATAYLWRIDGSLQQSLADEPVTVPLPRQPQGESITFSADGRAVLVGSEGTSQPVWSVPLPESLLPSRPADPQPASPAEAPGATRSAAATLSSVSGVAWTVAAVCAVAAVSAGVAVRHRRA